ncbi:unnamed protein product [Ixodes pacificus]
MRRSSGPCLQSTWTPFSTDSRPTPGTASLCCKCSTITCASTRTFAAAGSTNTFVTSLHHKWFATWTSWSLPFISRSSKAWRKSAGNSRGW